MLTDMEKEQREKMRFSSGIESEITRLDFQRERILEGSPENEFQNQDFRSTDPICFARA